MLISSWQNKLRIPVLHWPKHDPKNKLAWSILVRYGADNCISELISGLDNSTGIKQLQPNILLSINYFFPHFLFTKILVLPLLMAPTHVMFLFIIININYLRSTISIYDRSKTIVISFYYYLKNNNTENQNIQITSCISSKTWPINTTKFTDAN